MEKVNLIKETFASKTQYQEVIDTSFTELTTPTPVIDEILNVPTIDEFFQDYEQLFFEIPKFGETNSHEYLIKTSQAYIGSTVVNDEIVLLQQEITQLRRQLIELQTQPAQLISQTLQTSGLNLPQLTLPSLPTLPTFESPDAANAALDPNSTLSAKDLRKKQREERRAARRARRAQNNS
jgi:hypothetical protein